MNKMIITTNLEKCFDAIKCGIKDGANQVCVPLYEKELVDVIYDLLEKIGYTCSIGYDWDCYLAIFIQL